MALEKDGAGEFDEPGHIPDNNYDIVDGIIRSDEEEDLEFLKLSKLQRLKKEMKKE